uniref:ARAD1C43450p n=1 Tax=Blastobotrys adeninivorans TaxID=409370 RepID=A0A060T4B1_BLAAD
MSSKTLALNTLTQQFKKWPQDSKRVYASFKDFQTKQLQKAFESPESKLPSAENLNSQAAATRTLINETNKNKVSCLLECCTSAYTHTVHCPRVIAATIRYAKLLRPNRKRGRP